MDIRSLICWYSFGHVYVFQDLMLYLLQLVQALRYEDFTKIQDDFDQEKKVIVPMTPPPPMSPGRPRSDSSGHPLLGADVRQEERERSGL